MPARGPSTKPAIRKPRSGLASIFRAKRTARGFVPTTTSSRRLRPRRRMPPSMYRSAALLPTPARVLAAQKSRMKSGVTIPTRSTIAAAHTMADPSVAAFTMTFISAPRGERRFELYRPKEEKTRRHASKKSVKRAKFTSLIRMDRNSASDVAGFSRATSTVASPKESTINTRSKILAAWSTMRRRKVVIGAVPSLWARSRPIYFRISLKTKEIFQQATVTQVCRCYSEAEVNGMPIHGYFCKRSDRKTAVPHNGESTPGPGGMVLHGAVLNGELSVQDALAREAAKPENHDPVLKFHLGSSERH